MRIAICYFGLTRSTRKVYQTHHELLFAPLRGAGHSIDIYMHTWRTDAPCVWWTPSPPLDYEEYKLLEPGTYKIEEQSEFTATLDFGQLFNEEVYRTIGDCPEGEWHPHLIFNHMCALESQKRSFQMAQASGVAYDHVIFVRPDVRLRVAFDPAWLSSPYSIIIPDVDHFYGLNDRFAVIPFMAAAFYACRVDEIAEFRKSNGRIVSEKYVKFIIDKYYGKETQVTFPFELVR